MKKKKKTNWKKKNKTKKTKKQRNVLCGNFRDVTLMHYDVISLSLTLRVSENTNGLNMIV